MLTSGPATAAREAGQRPALHVAALPFPTLQGTQAAVAAMMDALAGEGREAHLLTYDGGTHEPDPTWTLHRSASPPGRDRLRSGPSLRKLAQDALLIPTLRRLHRELSPRAVVAHHVEAAAACLTGRVRPVVFFAHTAMGPELPVYGPSLLSGLLSRAGGRLDLGLCRRVQAVAALSPSLRDLLAQQSGREVDYVPVPWSVARETESGEREAARRALGLAEDASVVLYAGNLDGYQGWELLVDAMGRVLVERPRAVLLVGTASDTAPLLRQAIAAGVAARLRATPLGTESDRRALHAAADVAVVPRRVPGGLPVKLLDALARGVPTVAAARATAGLSLGGAAMIAADDDDEALANGILLALSAPAAAREVARRGRAYVAVEHHPRRFVEAMERVTERAASHQAGGRPVTPGER